MEENNKNTPPRKEGGHHNRGGHNRRDGHKNGNQGGQRISVRPGNFTPPADKLSSAPAQQSVKSAAANAEAPSGSRQENGGNRNGRNNHRNRHKNRNNHNQSQRPVQAPQVDAASEQASRAQAPTRKDGRRPARPDRRDERQYQNRRKEEPTLSESMQNALNEEFSTPLFSNPVGGNVKDKRLEEEAVDSQEFAVDIATAAYLVEDVPCGFPVPDGKAIEVVGVRFRRAGKVYFFAPGDDNYRIGESVLVDTARGPEIGEIVMLKRRIAEKDVIQPLRTVLRKATEQDKIHESENREKEAKALVTCAEKIALHKLDMRLVDAQYTFDNSKLLFYFTADARVDFRELVRDLAGIFHTRIELRQIGIRDETRLIGGLGACGRPFCCSTFLSDFGQVSVKMAKEQGLSLNTAKLSGTCGRLMCCLRYEHETYVAEARLTPKRDTRVVTPDGSGTVVDATPLAGLVKVKLDSAPDEAPRVYHRDTLTPVKREAPAEASAAPAEALAEAPAEAPAAPAEMPPTDSASEE